jgi:6-phosphofructokinase 1
MAGIVRTSDAPYTTEYKTFDIKTIANMVKAVPNEYINSGGNGITEAGLTYLRPLIVGETKPTFECGIPMHYIFPKI